MRKKLARTLFLIVVAMLAANLIIGAVFAQDDGDAPEDEASAPIPDLSSYESLNALLEAVDSGAVTAADALAWEESRQPPRKTAVKMLKARL